MSKYIYAACLGLSFFLLSSVYCMETAEKKESAIAVTLAGSFYHKSLHYPEGLLTPDGFVYINSENKICHINKDSYGNSYLEERIIYLQSQRIKRNQTHLFSQLYCNPPSTSIHSYTLDKLKGVPGNIGETLDGYCCWDCNNTNVVVADRSNDKPCTIQLYTIGTQELSHSFTIPYKPSLVTLTPSSTHIITQRHYKCIDVWDLKKLNTPISICCEPIDEILPLDNGVIISSHESIIQSMFDQNKTITLFTDNRKSFKKINLWGNYLVVSNNDRMLFFNRSTNKIAHSFPIPSTCLELDVYTLKRQAVNFIDILNNRCLVSLDNGFQLYTIANN